MTKTELLVKVDSKIRPKLYCYLPNITFLLSHAANTAVKRNAHVRDLRKRGKNKGKLYTKECRLNKNTKYKKTPENIR